MSTVTFYRAVMKAAGTDDRALAKRATAAVCHALRDRLTPEEADQAVAQLPLELKEVWEEGKREGRRPVKLDRAEFLERVARITTISEERNGRCVPATPKRAGRATGEPTSWRKPLTVAHEPSAEGGRAAGHL